MPSLKRLITILVIICLIIFFFMQFVIFLGTPKPKTYEQNFYAQIQSDDKPNNNK